MVSLPLYQRSAYTYSHKYIAKFNIFYHPGLSPLLFQGSEIHWYLQFMAYGMIYVWYLYVVHLEYILELYW